MKYFFTLTFAILSSFNVMAADLNSQDVSRWLNSMQVIQPWLENHESNLDESISENINDSNDISAIYEETIAAMKREGIYDDLNVKVKKLGYDNVEEWVQTSQKVSFAWIALEMESQKSEIEVAKAQYEAMINDPNIPNEQKEMMKQTMSSAFQILDFANEIPEADKQAVKSHQTELRAYFDSEDE